VVIIRLTALPTGLYRGVRGEASVKGRVGSRVVEVAEHRGRMGPRVGLGGRGSETVTVPGVAGAATWGRAPRNSGTGRGFW